MAWIDSRMTLPSEITFTHDYDPDVRERMRVVVRQFEPEEDVPLYGMSYRYKTQRYYELSVPRARRGFHCDHCGTTYEEKQQGDVF